LGIFELVENMCHTTQAVGHPLKGKKNYFLIFLENKCHDASNRTDTKREIKLFFGISRK